MLERVIGILEDFVHIVRENKVQEIKNYQENDTLPPRIKNVLKGMQTLRKKEGEGGGDAALLLIALNKFKQDIIVGAEDITQTFKDPSLPVAFRESLRDIFFEFNSKNQQLSSMLDDAFFYKDVIKAILGDKQISEDDIAMRENIAEDKRMSVIQLLAKIEDLRSGKGRKEEKGMKEGELKAEIGALEIKLAQMEKQVIKGKDQLTKTEEGLAKSRESLEKKDRQYQQNMRQVEKLREEINQMRRQSQMFQSSLALKQLKSGQLIAQKQSALQQLKDRDAEIRQLKKSLNDKMEELQRLKSDRYEEKEIKVSQIQNTLRQTNLKLNQAGLRCQTIQKDLNEAQQIIQEKSNQIYELQQQKERVRLEGSISAQDSQLVRRASAFLQSAEMFSQVYQHPRRAESSIISESIIFKSSRDSIKSLSASRKQEKMELEQFLKHSLHSSVLEKIIDALPKLPFGQPVYRYPEDKVFPFRQKLKGKKNLLLFCKVQNGAVLAAYSSCGFIDTQYASNPQVFIFCAKEKTFLLLHPKEGRRGVIDDEDFLIFGNEELSLGQGQEYATTYFQNKIQNLHFSGTYQERSHLLDLLDCHPPGYRILLNRYDILNLTP